MRMLFAFWNKLSEAMLSAERLSSAMGFPPTISGPVIPPISDISAIFPKNPPSYCSAPARLLVQPVTSKFSPPPSSLAAALMNSAASLRRSLGLSAPRSTGISSLPHSLSSRFVLRYTVSCVLFPKEQVTPSSSASGQPSTYSSARPSSTSQPGTPMVQSQSIISLSLSIVISLCRG